MAYTSEIEKLQRRYDEKPEQWFAALADAYRKSGELDVALEIVRKGIEERPNYVSGHIVLGRCLVDQNADQEAQTVFEQVLELDAENIIALKMLGDLAEREGDPYGARRWLERLLEVDPMNDDARTTLARLPMPVSPADALPAHAEALPSHFEEPEGLRRTAEAPDGAASEEVEAEPPAMERPAGFEATSDIERAAPTFEEAPEPSAEIAAPTVDSAAVEEEPPPAATPEPIIPEAVAGSDEAPAADETPIGELAAEFSEGFHIERHSDPFERPLEPAADQSLLSDDGADTGMPDGLWASLGEDPELRTIPDAQSLSAPPSAAQGGAAVSEGEEAMVGGGSSLGGEEPTDEGESTTPAPDAGGALGPAEDGVPTEEMPGITIDALAAQERAAAQDRRSEAAQGPPAEAPEPEEVDISEPIPVDAFELDILGDRDEPTAVAPETPEPMSRVDPEYEVDAPALEPLEELADEVEWLTDAPAAGEAAAEPEPSPVATPEGESDQSWDVTPGPVGEPPATSDSVVTETMAEVYASQGLFEQARQVYVELLNQRPGDVDLHDKLRALDAREGRALRPEQEGAASAQAAGADQSGGSASDGPLAVFRARSAVETGGVSARAFLAKVLAERPAVPGGDTVPPAPASDASTVESDGPSPLDTAFFEPAEEADEPPRPAAEDMSLASVFGDAASPSEPPPPSPPPMTAPGGDSGAVALDDSFGQTGEPASPPSGPSPEPPEHPGGSEGGPPPADDDEEFKAWLKSLKS